MPKNSRRSVADIRRELASMEGQINGGLWLRDCALLLAELDAVMKQASEDLASLAEHGRKLTRKRKKP